MILKVASPQDGQEIEHIQKIFTPEARYPLHPNAKEGERLALQHNLIKRFFGDQNIMAPVSLKAGDKVLDSGTGTGIWLLDVASTIPNSVELYGIDPESRLFPPKEFQPPNTHFSVESTISLPAEWTEEFSLVHQRLLVGGFTVPNWKKAIMEMHRVLKPGGYVDLCEFTWEWEGGGPISASWCDSVHAMGQQVDFLWSSGRLLKQWLEEAGFVDVQMVLVKKPIGIWGGEEGVVHRDIHMGAWRGMKSFIMTFGGVCGATTEEELDRLYDDLEGEIDQYEGTFTWVRCFGRKKMDCN